MSKDTEKPDGEQVYKTKKQKLYAEIAHDMKVIGTLDGTYSNIMTMSIDINTDCGNMSIELGPNLEPEIRRVIMSHYNQKLFKDEQSLKKML